MASLKIENLFKRYHDTDVVRGLHLDIADGELVALLGPSGCGKSTTLRMVAGFVEPTSGSILLDGRDITRLAPYRRDTGMVFQSYALFPHMSVAANVGFGLEMRKVGRAERDERIKAALDMVQLGHLAERMPKQLSGGQQQRVALARALAVNPALLLLDEPLSNLDAKLRAEVQHEIRDLQQRLGLTTLIVTHDQEEALVMADRMVVMQGGVVRQAGTPKELYETPADVFVAGFIGRCNLIAGEPIAPGTFRAESGALFHGLAEETSGVGGKVLALRPEHIAMTTAGEGGSRIGRITYLGASTEYEVDFAGTRLLVVAATDNRYPQWQVGDHVTLDWAKQNARLLPANQ
ncbi:ABC transporter ATP-binding protein [Martelella alba]|uniref:ABC transporter ATP-binding protein n=1 Tax=Martelella alba TaxID=2590451 RepID=A0A506U1M3_9HYPH|nr:ABC transporter ATP-binding protein [Martelella alba]TPW26865.1 ABC transporter ATP-binding protein [Martelella alba]